MKRKNILLILVIATAVAACAWGIHAYVYHIPTGPKLPEQLPAKKPTKEAVAINNRARMAQTGYDFVNRTNLEGGPNLEEALRLYDEAFRSDPNYYGALANKATLLMQMERYAEAVECLKGVVQIRPRHAEAYLGLAYCQHKIGDAKASRNSLMKALSSQNYRFEQSGSPDDRVQRAVVLFLLGYDAVARRELGELSDDNELAALVLEEINKCEEGDRWFMFNN